MTRYAAYYAPAPDAPLWRAGCAWLGRDPTGAPPLPPPDVADIAAITSDASGYGFHATLKPPMRLRDGVGRAALLDALAETAAAIPRFTLPPLVVTDFHGFLCLRETQESASLQALADAAVAGLDHLRAPPDAPELARRRSGGLSPAREANLSRWGYPDVFATWFFHMTLTRRLDAAEMTVIRPAAERWFSGLLAPRPVTDICLFEQPPGQSFALTARVPLTS